MGRRLGVGFIGSGFMTRFHIRSWQAVRDGDVRGVWSPNPAHAEEAAALARELNVGEAKAYPTLEAMVEDPAIDAIWICGPNHTRIENMERDRGGARPRRPRWWPSPARSRSAATPPKPPGWSSSSNEAACCTATSRTSCSPRPWNAARPSSGPAARRSPAGRTWPGRPKSTAGRTCRGSGAAICRAAAC